jgi:hypothetical protein
MSTYSDIAKRYPKLRIVKESTDYLDIKLDNMLFRMSLTLSNKICDVLFENLEKLQGQAPEFGYKGELEDRTHANLITLIVGIDQLTDADLLWKTAYDRAERNEDITRPEIVVESFRPEDCIPSERKCKICLKDCRFKHLIRQIQHLHRMKTKMAVRWLHNSVMLQKYGYDARKIPLGIPTARLQNHIQKDEFDGYSWQGLGGDKLFSLWVRIETDYEYWKIEDLGEIDIPVDNHIAKVPFRTGALSLVEPKFAKVSIEKVKPLIRFFFRTGKGIPLQYDEPVWNLSKRICSQCGKVWCPLSEICQKLVIVGSGGCYGTLFLKSVS